jgi:hypothetical protein
VADATLAARKLELLEFRDDVLIRGRAEVRWDDRCSRLGWGKWHDLIVAGQSDSSLRRIENGDASFKYDCCSVSETSRFFRVLGRTRWVGNLGSHLVNGHSLTVTLNRWFMLVQWTAKIWTNCPKSRIQCTFLRGRWVKPSTV